MAKKKKVKQSITFQWHGLSSDGVKRNGEIDATSLKVARRSVQNDGIRIKKIKKRAEPLFGSSIKVKDIVIISRQLATMIDGGIPVSQCLSVVGQSSDNPAVKSLLTKMRLRIEEGSNLTSTLRQHPEHFNSLYVGLVNVGEESGTLGLMLGKVAAYMEKAESIRGKIKSALMYPVIVMIFGLLIVTGLLLYVIPQFQKLFEENGAELPALTAAVVTASEVLQNHWLIVFASAGFTVFLIKMSYKRSAGFRYKMDKLILNLPVFGDLIRKGVIVKVTRTVAIMFRSGIPMVEILGVIAPVSGNAVFTRALSEVQNKIATGQPLEPALKESKEFPSMVLQMVRTGEETGEMDAMLDKAADFYEDEVDNTIAGISTLIEPLMIVILGGIIGVVIIAMYLPIFSLGEVF